MCCGGGGSKRKHRGGGGGGGGSAMINSLAYGQAMGFQTPPSSPSRFSSRSKRLNHIKVEATTRQLQNTGSQAWDQSFFGASNGFRKGKSRHRASQGSDLSWHSNRGSNGSVRSTTPTNPWPQPLPQSMFVGKPSREIPTPIPTFRGKLKASKAGLNGMAQTAGGFAEYGRQVSAVTTQAASNWGDAGRQWNARKRPKRFF
ncbi:hypothetical protein FPANT_1943 [Fusarium pseudoanthophilum]|uniref:Uncharacterized protein n=1 Tax=Fusarium pseudoanthophilum TaxID=48495 RepID=A0A8H5PRG3_9HYPO|nr:hypothetical protein FPANT_1943 [Fusarium pseudoanthophilum]